MVTSPIRSSSPTRLRTSSTRSVRTAASTSRLTAAMRLRTVLPGSALSKIETSSSNASAYRPAPSHAAPRAARREHADAVKATLKGKPFTLVCERERSLTVALERESSSAVRLRRRQPARLTRPLRRVFGLGGP